MAIKILTIKLGILLMTFSLPAGLFASGTSELLSAKIVSYDQISLQNGATTYMNYCAACHSLKHMRYEVLVEGLGVSAEIIKKNLMFTGDKITDHITNNLPHKDAKDWFGIVPPDLTLSARVHGADWLFTYLKSFYTDEKRPFGVNNTLFKDVGMPHVLAPLQGQQVKSQAAQVLESKIASAEIAMAIANRDDDEDTLSIQSSLLNDATHSIEQLKHEKKYFEIVKEGSLTAEEYTVLVRDLVNFMDYAAEPIKLERQALGIKVILFLLVLLILTYLLKKEYWRDVIH